MQTATRRTKRTRMTLSKVRTGCLTCKARRVKCDERKPTCQRCISTRRHCAGYADLATRNDKPKPFTITYYFVPDVLPEEQHALDHFYHWAGRCFPSELMTPFRQQNILHEPAIRHAMIALGVLSELYLRSAAPGPSRIQRTMFAMQHYGKALHILSSRKHDTFDSSSSSSTVSILLLACFLFVCLETSQGHHKSALGHLQSGFKLFQEAKASAKLDTTASYASESVFRSLFVRSICQLTHFDSTDCARFYRLGGRSRTPSDRPLAFTTIDEARICFGNMLERWIHRRYLSSICRSHDDDDDDNVRGIFAQELVELDEWILAFNLYLSYGVSTSHTCDSYFLAMCSFLLKFRIMVDQRGSAGNLQGAQNDFRHIESLGEIFLAGCESSVDAAIVESGLECPMQRLPNNNIPINRASPSSSSSSSCQTNEHPLFPFLGVFCALLVASFHSPDPTIRRKAYGTILSKGACCRCEKRCWGYSNLTIYIAQQLAPAEEERKWQQQQQQNPQPNDETGLDWNNIFLPQDAAGSSSEIGKLVTLLRSF